jgi:tRNA pseudouridine13 synthase
MNMEEAVGLEIYFTEGPGIGGRIKATPEDFVVEELLQRTPEVPHGKYTVALIRSRNWETNHLVRALARLLRISRRRVTFAGTKDKRAVSTQLLQFQAPPEEVRALRLKDVEVLEAYATDGKLEIGDLLGNRFQVMVRDIALPLPEAKARVEAVLAELEAEGGFPNFFGVQRFGALRPVTHLVGKAIVKGDFQRAVELYVAHPIEGEGPRAYAARKRMGETWDVAEALRTYPRELSFEKALLNHLVQYPEDHPGALRRLPLNLQMMFIHSYQSYLFNRILSERIRRGLPLGRPLEGDFILPTLRGGLPDRDRPILVTPDNLSRIEAQCRARRAFVSGLVFGAETRFAGGEMGEIEARVVEAEDLRPGEFVIPALPHVSSKGTRREVLAPIGELAWAPGEASVWFSFRLMRGAYATSFLREIMKASPIAY